MHIKLIFPLAPKLINQLIRSVLIGAFASTLLIGCATAQKPSEAPLKLDAPNKSNTISEEMVQQLLTQVSLLAKRVDTLDTQLAVVNDQLQASRPASANSTSMTAQTKENKPPAKSASNSVASPPSEQAGAPETSHPAPHDPELGFVNDEAIQAFRKAMILLQGQSFPEAILAFSAFLEKFPDHPLAGSAQFYVGEAYLKQKEYKLALSEFSRVLTTYDRSAHIADTLSEMAQAEDILKNAHEAAIHRQLLSSLFPQSPAASSNNLISNVSNVSNTPAPSTSDGGSMDKTKNEESPNEPSGIKEQVPMITPLTAPMDPSLMKDTPERH